MAMIDSYAIDVVVFNETKSKFFFGFKNKDYDTCLAKIVSVCEKKSVKCKTLSFDKINKFAKDYLKSIDKNLMSYSYLNQAFFMLMIFEGISIAEVSKIAIHMQRMQETLDELKSNMQTKNSYMAR